jgi:hypothetical protein
MVQKQTNLARRPRPVADHPEKVMQLHERHVRVDILDISGEQGIL